MIYIFAAKAESCHANTIKWVGITLVKDIIMLLLLFQRFSVFIPWRDYMINMLGSIPHQKFCFYHLPTWGRAGIKLGMLIRLQRIYNFLLFHAIILSILDTLYAFLCYFTSFFGTNLLTQCPVPVAIFCLFLPFQKIIIKKCPNEKKTLD